MSIVALNAGSSSIKFALFDDSTSLHLRLRGRVEHIGTANAALSVEQPGDALESVSIEARDHTAAADALFEWLQARRLLADASAIGHRIVQGGPRFHEPAKVNAELLMELDRVRAFSPGHLPAQIDLIERCAQRLAAIPQVACFDSAFHHDMPRVAQIMPIPRRLGDQGIRRHGFHGLSYQFLMESLANVAGASAAQGAVVLAHLGSGSSLAAVSNGRSVDTTMGITPASGIPTSTRSGDLDPGLAMYLANTGQMSAAQFHHMVNHESGLLGISETSADVRELLTREADVRCAEAVAVYCYRIATSIGALAAALNGLDTLVFSGGIGENLPQIRDRVCARLTFLGVKLDALRNARNSPVLSREESRVTVRMIRTDEEAMIARQTHDVLSGSRSPRAFATGEPA